MKKTQGNRLLEKCKRYVLATMRKLPGCSPRGPGLRSREIEKAACLSLHLSQHNGWVTWSLLMSLAESGKVKVTRRGKRGIRHFRLK